MLKGAACGPQSPLGCCLESKRYMRRAGDWSGDYSYASDREEGPSPEAALQAPPAVQPRIGPWDLGPAYPGHERGHGLRQGLGPPLGACGFIPSGETVSGSQLWSVCLTGES